jgi:spermidine/putrescine transport system substrate-binding protein
MCETDIAYENADYIGYATPHTEAKKKMSPELLADIAAYPNNDQIKNCEVFEDLADVIKDYDRIWTEISAK